MKKTVFAVGLFSVAAALLFFKPALSQSGGALQAGTPPPYCNPCLFYGGDFDPANSAADSSGNMYHTYPDKLLATTYVPFYVPKGQVWTVRGLFSNNLADVPYIDPQQMNWSISEGVRPGKAGKLIASGSVPATFTPTGRAFGGMNEYTLLGKLPPGKSVVLASGIYWMSAVPVCDTGHCADGFYFIADVEDVPAPNRKGFEPNDDSYYSVEESGGPFFQPTWGSSGACGGVGCDRFSAGLLGHAAPAQ